MAMEKGKCGNAMLASFDLNTSHGCLKLSEFYQESDYGVKNHLIQCLGPQNKVLHKFDIFFCIPPS